VNIEYIISLPSPSSLLTALERIFPTKPVDKKDESGKDDEISVCFGDCCLLSSIVIVLIKIFYYYYYYYCYYYYYFGNISLGGISL
jgi:hypothetical protein